MNIDLNQLKYFLFLKPSKIKDEDWDIHSVTIIEYFDFIPLSFEFFESKDFKTTRFFDFYSKLRGYEESIIYCEKYLNLYKSILTKGYLHQNQLDHRYPKIHLASKNLVQVCLNRFGVYGLAKNGQHRLAICLHQKIKKIPVDLVLVHPYSRLY